MTQGTRFPGSVVQFHWSVAGLKKESRREGERGPNRPFSNLIFCQIFTIVFANFAEIYASFA